MEWIIGGIFASLVIALAVALSRMHKPSIKVTPQQPPEPAPVTQPCSLTNRLKDCWESGCLGYDGCSYRKASAVDRYAADTGALPGQTVGDW